MKQQGALNDERALRQAVEDLRRKGREAEEGDVFITHPRRLFMTSPGGKTFLVSIDDSGNLSTTETTL